MHRAAPARPRRARQGGRPRCISGVQDKCMRSFHGYHKLASPTLTPSYSNATQGCGDGLAGNHKAPTAACPNAPLRLCVTPQRAGCRSLWSWTRWHPYEPYQRRVGYLLLDQVIARCNARRLPRCTAHSAAAWKTNGPDVAFESNSLNTHREL